MDKTCSFQKLKWAAALMPTLFTLYQLVTLNSASGPPIPFRFLDHSYFLLCSPWTFEMNSGAINFSDKHCWKWFLGALYQPWQMQVLVTQASTKRNSEHTCRETTRIESFTYYHSLAFKIHLAQRVCCCDVAVLSESLRALRLVPCCYMYL